MYNTHRARILFSTQMALIPVLILYVLFLAWAVRFLLFQKASLRLFPGNLSI